MIELRMPNLTADTLPGKVSQLQSYLYQLSEELNHALNAAEAAQEARVVELSKQNSKIEPGTPAAESTFEAVKSLIIKSADIVSAYYDEMTKTFNSQYFAGSDFGNFKNDTTTQINANAERIQQTITNVQTVSTNVTGLGNTVAQIETEMRETKGYIRSGILGTDQQGNNILGVEVGQNFGLSNEERFARFTADGVHIYNSNGTEVAYFTNDRMYITSAEVKRSFRVGGYVMKDDGSGGLVFSWAGG